MDKVFLPPACCPTANSSMSGCFCCLLDHNGLQHASLKRLTFLLYPIYLCFELDLCCRCHCLLSLSAVERQEVVDCCLLLYHRGGLLQQHPKAFYLPSPPPPLPANIASGPPHHHQLKLAR